jgi:hypothetical protein
MRRQYRFESLPDRIAPSGCAAEVAPQEVEGREAEDVGPTDGVEYPVCEPGEIGDGVDGEGGGGSW